MSAAADGDGDSSGRGSPGTTSAVRPPFLAQALLRRLLPSHEREEILGDMAESYARRVRRQQGWVPRLWYWRQAVAIPARILWRRAATAGLIGGEVRQALRSLMHSPGFTTVAVLSLGLGIGANTAIFSTVRSVMYQKLPVERPDELKLVYSARPAIRVSVNQRNSSSGTDPASGERVGSNYSYAAYERMRSAAGDSVHLLGFNFIRQLSILVEDRPAVAVGGMMVSGNYFSTLGLDTILGRPLTGADDRPSASRVAVISYSLWQRAFGGDPSIIDKAARLNGVPFRIVGVTAPAYTGLSPGGFFPPTDVTVPLAAQPVVTPRWASDEQSLFTLENYFWVRLIARVPAGLDTRPLDDLLTTTWRESLINASLIDAAEGDQVDVTFLPGGRGLDSLRRGTEEPLQILTAVVAAVLLIACANLASLMLARGTARQHELAVRQALGAGRWRLARQLFLESLILSTAGGAVGLLLALWSGPAITAALTAGIGPVAVRFELDTAMLSIVAAVSLAAAILCGLLPALRLSGIDAYGHLRARGGVGGSSRLPLGRFLIAAQIAVSIPLVVGAGLFLRTVANLGNVDPGFDPRGLIVFKVEPSLVTSDPQRSSQIYQQVMANVESLPGVMSATYQENVPLSGWISNTSVTVDGGEEIRMLQNAVGPRYFETLGMTLLEGRAIERHDTAGASTVAVVNEAAAQRLFGGQALGRTFRKKDQDFLVVGIVADSKYDTLREETEPTIYDSYLQRDPWQLNVVVRSAVPTAQLEPLLRDAVARVDRQLPVTDLRTQSEQIATAVAKERVFARLLAAFGGFALLIACIGLHGVTSFSVAQRTSEMGVRLALGARSQQIRWLVLKQVLLLATVGLAVGIPAAWLASPVVGSMLYGLEPTDVSTLVGSGAVMFLVALLAGWLPALRASRTDAVIALARE